MSKRKTKSRLKNWIAERRGRYVATVLIAAETRQQAQDIANSGGGDQVDVTYYAFGTTYFFAATAVSTNGVDESAYSNEVSWNSPTAISPPGTLSIQSWTAYALPGPWTPDTNWPPVLVQNPMGNQWWRLEATRQ